MIQIYTGVPGSGKSYKMVQDLSGELMSREKRADGEPLTVISNIKGLKLPHVDFDDFLIESFPEKSLKLKDRIEKFFDYDNQAQLNQLFGGPIMYVLDECQLYFPTRISLPVTEAYMQRHRHLGHYLYLATQNTRLVNSSIKSLIELEYNAARRSMSFFGEFRYRVKSPQSNEVISTITTRPKQSIFELYKSFEADELKRPKRLLIRKLWPVLLLPLAVYLFYVGAFSRAQASKNAVTQSKAAAAHVSNGSGQAAVEKADGEAAALRQEVAALRRRLNEQERVFLPVVQVGKQMLTVDPDTQAVVELRRIKHKVVCVNGGLSCYYDRPVNSGVRLAGDSLSSGSWGTHGGSSLPMGLQTNQPFMRSRPVEPRPGAGSFVEPSMVPAPGR